jgi:basic membrane protein A
LEKKLKIVLIVLILFLPVIPLSSATPSQKSAPAKVENLTNVTAAKKVAVIFSTGGFGDKSLNDAGMLGVVQAQFEFGTNISVDWAVPQDLADFKTLQTDYAENGSYDLIICIGFLQLSALNETSLTYPNQNWVLIDDEINRLNIKNYIFDDHKGSFLVGAMAGMTTKTGKIGFVGGTDNYLINKFLAGYEQGAHHIDSSIEVTAVYSPIPPPKCFNNIPSGKELGITLINRGNDVIFAAAGSTNIGVFQAANESEDVYAIGSYNNQDAEIPGVVLTSMRKLVELAVYRAINETVHATWENGTEVLGLQNGGVGMTDMSLTQTEANEDFTLNGVKKTRYEWAMVFYQQIINETITVVKTPDWDKLVSFQVVTPGFEGLLAIIFLLGLATIQINKYRRS